MPIQYHDFDLLIERSGDGFKARVIDSPAGEATTQIQLPFTQADVENFYTQIGHTRLFETSQMQKMRIFGQELFEATFTGNVRDKFRESLSEVNRNREGLRIRLRLADVPELANMPWEFMYDTSLSRFLALSIETPLVRYLDVPRDIQPLTVHPPLKILAVISSPRNFPTLNVQREWDNLQEALSKLESRELVRLTRLEKPTLQSLQRQLRRDEFHVFHFIGHGIFSKQYQDGQLLFEDELKGGDPVSSRDLGILLHDHRQLRLAVLNACEGARTSMEDQFSGTAQSLIQQGLPAVIAMQFRITDIAAITLAREFYAALADGYPVDASLTEARKSIKTHGNELEWGTPVLYMRSPNGQIFDVESIKQAKNATAQPVAIPDAETEKQLAILYTEGLEAFYLKEWEKAVTKFKSILAVQSDHKDAAVKIKTAQHQLKLSNLDQQAQLAESKGDWASAIKALEALYKEFPEETSFLSRLEISRKQLRVKNLYAEAQQLSKAKKWLAVVQVFHEIHSLDAEFSDTDKLLPLAEDAAETEKVQAELESQYQKALQAIDANEWPTARDTLQNIQSKQEKYRQTEKLLQRAEDEIAHKKKQQQEQEQIASLYLQAENLVSRKQWEKALEKIEEISKIQPGFNDPGQIANLARAEMDKAQEETEKQDQLATLYAEAVKFNQAGEYQKALDQWIHIRDIDTTYPDKQRVQATASRMLKKIAKPERISKKIAWKPNLQPGWGILAVGIIWYAIGLGAIFITGLFEISNPAISELLRWSLFGITTGLLNLLAFHLFKFNLSNKQKIILVGGWFVSSLAIPMMVWLLPDFIFRYHIGYTLTGTFYGLVLHSTLPHSLHKPNLSSLVFALAFGMFAGECSYTWFRYSASIAAPHYTALTLGIAGLTSISLAFSKTISASAERKSTLTIEKTALTIAGVLIAARWLGSVIGDNIAFIILNPAGKNWDTAPYLMLNMWYGLFAVFAAWFLVWFLKNKLFIPITKKEIAILVTSWIAGMVATSILCVYLGIELSTDWGDKWGWKIGWGVGGLVIGLGMWLATKKYSQRNKSTYLVTSILGWGVGFFLSEQISGNLQAFFIHFFGDALGGNITVNANVGFAGLLGGLVLISQLNTVQERHINWKTVLASTLGFAIGNGIVNTIFYNSDGFLFLQYFLWGAIGSAALAFPSKDYKKYLILGGIGGLGLALGNQINLSLDQLSFDIVVWGIFGLILGLYTKNVYKAFIFGMLTPLANNVRWELRTLLFETIQPKNPAIEVVIAGGSALVLGLILGMIWSFLEEKTTFTKDKETEITKKRTVPNSIRTSWKWLKVFFIFAFSRVIIEIIINTTGLFQILISTISNTGAPIIKFLFLGFSTGSAMWLILREKHVTSDWKTWLIISLTSSISLTTFFTSALLADIGAWSWTVAWALIGICVGLVLAYCVRKKIPGLPKRLYWQLPLIWAISCVIGQQAASDISFLIYGITASLKDILTRSVETGIYGLVGSLLTISLLKFEHNHEKKDFAVTIGILFALLTSFAFATGLQTTQRSFIDEPFASAIGLWGSIDIDRSIQTLSIRRSLFTGNYTLKYTDSYTKSCAGTVSASQSGKTQSPIWSMRLTYKCNTNDSIKTISTASETFYYKPFTDTIMDNSYNTWRRK